MQYAEERMTELWKKSNPSSDGTHHVVNDGPMYGERFLRVMSFHEPGLAAVRGEQGAWHIDVQGVPAYPHIFLKTFGFYENLAAIKDKNGWLHITPDGVAAYAAVYDWCGNFQDGRAVVRLNDDYFHILPDGNALYERRFAYAGDFREHRAVVRLANGLCTHIDKDGAFAHSHCYRDLGVYHKGFSCARDDGGWMHVNVDGARYTTDDSRRWNRFTTSVRWRIRLTVKS